MHRPEFCLLSQHTVTLIDFPSGFWNSNKHTILRQVENIEKEKFARRVSNFPGVPTHVSPWTPYLQGKLESLPMYLPGHPTYKGKKESLLPGLLASSAHVRVLLVREIEKDGRRILSLCSRLLMARRSGFYTVITLFLRMGCQQPILY